MANQPQGVDPLLTDVTRTVHRTSYPAIDPSRPELSHSGRTVLITGGSEGIGLAIAEAFIKASAATVIITGRRQEAIDEAVAALTKLAKNGVVTKIIGKKSDAADPQAIDALWDDLAGDSVSVDVLVLNAAKFATYKPLLELGIDNVWKSFEVNVRGVLHFAERFHKQPVGDGGPRPKALINISTAAIHIASSTYSPMVASGPDYPLTKGAGTLALQFVAQDTDPAEFQIVTYHPGFIYTASWERAGLPSDIMKFDDGMLETFFPLDLSFLSSLWQLIAPLCPENKTDQLSV
jgi:NAD(P)-dependent dehydrogenase (short-subunit alcohol dehydrogenase family)